MGNKPYVVAFYSPLGGVQRTTTTLLTGLSLAEKYELSAAVVDLDIETPGIIAYNLNCPKHYATIYDAYLNARLSGELCRSPWSDKLYVLPMAPNPSAASHMAYSMGYTLSRLEELSRRELVRIFKNIVKDITEEYNARVILIDTGPGIESLSRIALKYLADAVVLLSRADGVSMRRFISMVRELVRRGDLRLGHGERYEQVFFVFTSIPSILSSNIDELLSNKYREIWKELGTPYLPENFASIPLVPELLSPSTDDPIYIIRKNKKQEPYKKIVEAIDFIARNIAGRAAI
jgi:cellulose biosynthesis protein BcsQ